MKAPQDAFQSSAHHIIPADDPSFRFTDRIPTLDDFALALIQGGYANGAVLVDKDGWTYPKGLYDLAAELKAESDRRRGI